MHGIGCCLLPRVFAGPDDLNYLVHAVTHGSLLSSARRQARGHLAKDTVLGFQQALRFLENLSSLVANSAIVPGVRLVKPHQFFLDKEVERLVVGQPDDDGHAFTSWPSSTGIAAPTWVDTDFRDRLGFSGNESAVTVDGLTVLTADYPLPGLLVTSEQLQLPPRDVPVEDSSTLALVGGGYASTLWRRVRRWEASFYLDGPAAASAQHRHYVDRFLPYVSRGRPLTLYPEWGDPRRRLDPMSITASVDAYGLLYTSQDHGERGRIIGSVADNNSAERPMEWRADGIRTRVLQTWVIEEG